MVKTSNAAGTKKQTMSQVARNAIAGLIAVAAIGSTGCQMDVGGQTLPSPYYIYDDVQYFPAGPEFKLSREAAAMKAYSDGEAAN